MTRTNLYKILSPEEWEAAQRQGRFDGSAVDLADGYIHLSAANQVVETAAKHFAGKENLLLVAVDGARLGDSLRWEPSRGGQLFPHVYGPLPLDAVVAVQPLPVGADGRHVFPDLL